MAKKEKINLPLVAILAFSALLRFFNLGKQSLWVDEFLSYGAFQSTPIAPYWKKFLYDVHAPFYHLFMNIWSRVSLNEWWTRIPSAVAGVIAVYLLYKWVSHFMDHKASLVSSFLLGVNPMHIYYSQEVRFYSFLVLFSLLSLLSFERFVKEPNGKNALLLGVALVLSCLSHFSALIIVLAFFIVLVISRKKRWERVRLFLLSLVVLAIFTSPWIYREISFLRGLRDENVIGFSVPVEERFRRELSLTPYVYPYSLYAFSTGYSFGPDLRELHTQGVQEILKKYWLRILIFSISFVPVFIAGLFHIRKVKRLSLFLSIFLVYLITLTLLALMNIKVFNVRYMLGALGVFIATVSYGILSFKGKLKYSAIILIVSVMLFSDFNYHFVPRYQRDDVKGAAELVERYGESEDVVLAITVWNIFEFYYHGDVAVYKIFPDVMGMAKVRKRVEELSEEHKRIWYLRCRYWEHDPGDLLLKVLRNSLKLEKLWKLPGVNLYLFSTEGGK